MISVVIAAYNGEKYIAEQIKSILVQLSENDEIIVSDDNPQGLTQKAVEDAAPGDKRIKYVEGPGKGVIKNFENAIKHTQGDYIFLSDQDDVWLDGKVEAVMSEFEKGADVVMHDALITDSHLKPTGETAFTVNNTKVGIIRNVIKNSYQGSCMAFSEGMKKYILPFPKNIPMHDQWIGLVGEKCGEIHLITQPYILYRRHGGNISGNGSTMIQKIIWRVDIIACLLRK